MALTGVQFDYANDDTPIFSTSNLATQTYALTPEHDPPIGQWDPEIKLLNYPPDETWPFHCDAFEPKPEEMLTEADLNAPMPVKAV